MTMALASDQEVNLFEGLGFTLDDIETIEVPYQVNRTPRLHKLDLDKTKELLAPLERSQQRFTGRVVDSPHKILLFLKYGDQGENVGELRKLRGDEGCGQITISLCIANDGSCLYLSPTRKDNYDYRYYSPHVAKLKSFVDESMLCV